MYNSEGAVNSYIDLTQLEGSLKRVAEELELFSCIASQPISSLRKSLQKMTLPMLRPIAQRYDLSGYRRMKKEELIISLFAAITDFDRFSKFFLEANYFARREFEKALFLNIADLKISPSSAKKMKYFMELGYVHCFKYDGKISFVIPDEIKSLYQNLCSSGALTEVTRANHFYDYTAAAVHLYGVLPVSQLIGIFNGNEYRTSSQEEYETLMKKYFADPELYGFFIKDGLLISSKFLNSDFSEVEALYNESSKKARYIPLKQVFLKYADPDYYEKTPAINSLEWFLVKYFQSNPFATDLILTKLVSMIRVGATISEYLNLFSSWGLSEPRVDFPKLMEYVGKVEKSVRTWRHNGHSELEISLFRTNIKKIAKLGRNDPCFCGSGKKYKKCCGANKF